MPRNAAVEQLDATLDAALAGALGRTLDAALTLRELQRCDYSDGERMAAACLRDLMGAATALVAAAEFFPRIASADR